MSTLPPADRPRERLWALGPAALTTAELLAIVIGTGRGRRGVLDVAGGLLELSEGSLRRLSQRPRSEWLRTEGIGPTKAARLAAAFELGTRLAREERPPLQRIREPEDVARRFANRLRDLQVEEFHLLALDSQSQVLREVLITRGLLNSSLVHPREVFRAAIVEAAAGIIVVHNHPSGDPTPLGRGSSGHPTAGGGRAAAGPAPVRPRDHRGRPVPEPGDGRAALTGRNCKRHRQIGPAAREPHGATPAGRAPGLR